MVSVQELFKQSCEPRPAGQGLCLDGSSPSPPPKKRFPEMYRSSPKEIKAMLQQRERNKNHAGSLRICFPRSVSPPAVVLARATPTRTSLASSFEDSRQHSHQRRRRRRELCRRGSLLLRSLETFNTGRAHSPPGTGNTKTMVFTRSDRLPTDQSSAKHNPGPGSYKDISWGERQPSSEVRNPASGIRFDGNAGHVPFWRTDVSHELTPPRATIGTPDRIAGVGSIPGASFGHRVPGPEPFPGEGSTLRLHATVQDGGHAAPAWPFSAMARDVGGWMRRPITPAGSLSGAEEKMLSRCRTAPSFTFTTSIDGEALE